MTARLVIAPVLLAAAAGLVAAADYPRALLKESLPGSKTPGKYAPNFLVEYKDKKGEVKTAEVFLTVGFMAAPGPLDETGKAIRLEKLIDYFKVGTVADLKTVKKADGIEYVTGFRAVKADK